MAGIADEMGGIDPQARQGVVIFVIEIGVEDEIEVSVFGPGKGECIVLHVGSGRWVVVDSCIEPGDSWSVAERYLRGLGVALESQVDT